MLRWLFGSICALAVFGGCAFAGFEFGVARERAANWKAQAEQLERDLDAAGAEISEARTWGLQMADGTKRVADAVNAANNAGTRYVKELTRALDDSDLAACLLPADVQRLRAVRYAEARAAADPAPAR